MPGRIRCRAHAACIAAPHAPCRCVVHSLCCGYENNGSGTPRARASAPRGCATRACLLTAASPNPPPGGFRFAAGWAGLALPIPLRGHRCQAASGAARTPRALLRSTHRAAAMFVRRAMAAHGRGTPRARALAEAAAAGCARGHWFAHPSPQGSRKGTHRPRLQPASGLPCAAGGASFSSPPSPPQGRYTPRYAVSAAVGGPVNAACGRVAPASCWAASNVYSPVGSRNEPSLRFGLLALAPSAPAGPKVCSRLRPLHGFFQCFRPGRGEYSHAVEPIKGTPRSARWLRHP